ncbi:MAG: hypothetical protein AAGC78_20745 [Cellvibrio sp.]|uniref:hypothetical protein n=1 Tax=Cellvibrio sp. TaxID=1965322 RepID=UPI0031AAB716
MSHAKALLIKILTRSTFVTGLALGIVLIPNLAIFDEALAPEISQLLSNPANPDIPGNAAPDAYGLAAESSRDIKQVGEKFIAALRDKRAQGKSASLSEQEIKDFLGGSDFDKTWQALYPAAKCVPREYDNCFENLLADINVTPITNERLHSQIERYRLIIQQSHYIEDIRSMDSASPLPSYGPMLQLGKIINADAYLTKGIDGLIETARADLKFWRIVLGESQTILGKMIALNALRGDLQALSYAISQQPALSDKQRQELQNLLLPLGREEIAIDEALLTEFRMMVENRQTFFLFFSATPGNESWFLNLLVQPTASVNRYFKYAYQPSYNFSKLTAPEFYMRAQAPIRPVEFSRFNPYNLGGKIKLSQPWQIADYIGRAHDLAGIYSLVSLQLELTAAAQQDISERIASSSYKNPYSEKSFDYDAKTNTLSFRCFDVKDTCKIRL